MEQKLIKSRIFIIRGKQVMFDRDLARLYNVQTRVLNQTVKRNAKRFPEQFMFQLTSEEFDNWKSQIVTSNSEKMGLRKLPYVLTEYGVAMLSGVLNSEIALNINIEIIQTFIDSRASTKHSPSLQRRVSEIESRLINQENKFNEIFNFISENKFPQSGIFFQNQIFDAYVFSDDKELYHLGASLKDLGKRWFAFSIPIAIRRMDSCLKYSPIFIIRKSKTFAKHSPEGHSSERHSRGVSPI